MRKFLLLLAACALLVTAAPVLARAQQFPDFTPMGNGPEGIAVDKTGNVYVSVGIPDSGHTEIWRFDRTGDGEVLATLPGASPAGLAVRPNAKHVYVAMQFGGVFAVDKAGGFELVPGTAAIVLPNSLAFDDDGNLYITETFSFDAADGLDLYPNCVNPDIGFNGYFGRGGLWVVPTGGEAELLLRHDLLTGLCVPNPIPFPVGANGLAIDDDKLIVANTEKALLVEFPILGVRDLGHPSVITRVEGSGPFGPWLLDGIALDVRGNIYAAVVTGSAIVRVSPDGSDIEVMATSEDGLDFPASLSFGTGNGERRNVFVTNLAIGPTSTSPGIVKISVGKPGMPLP